MTCFGYNLCVMENRHGLPYLTLLFTYRNDNVIENHNFCVMENRDKFWSRFSIGYLTVLPKCQLEHYSTEAATCKNLKI